MNLKCTVFVGLLVIVANSYAREEVIIATANDSSVQITSERVMGEAYKQIGIEMSILFLPNVRSLFTSNSGKVDGELSRVRHIDRIYTNLIRVPVSINRIEAQAFSTREDLVIKNWESLRGYNLICVRGVLFVERSLSEKKINCRYVNTFVQAILMVQVDRADIAILPKLNGQKSIEETGAFDVKEIGMPLELVDIYHYLHKKNRSIIPRLQAVLAEMKRVGRIEEIRKEVIGKVFSAKYSTKRITGDTVKHKGDVI